MEKGTTEFFEEVKRHPTKIGWNDIFSDCLKKHTKKDMEYAFLAGTTMDTATENNMLQKWKKPWLFWRLLIGGGILLALIYGMLYIAGYMNALTMAQIYISIVIPPIVTPFILMIFVWELNIPRNISIYELLIICVVGGIFSLLVTGLLSIVIKDDFWLSAFGLITQEEAIRISVREELAKLIAAILALVFLQNNKKLYGLSGLVVGAAVGTGFSAFESISYAMSYGDSFYNILHLHLLRGVLAVGGHTVYAAPYVAAFALHAKKGKISIESIFNVDFVITLAGSLLAHWAWDAPVLEGFGYLKYVLISVGLWIEMLYITRKCLAQVVMLGNRVSAGGAIVYCHDKQSVVKYNLSSENVQFVVGSLVSCDIRFIHSKRVSRNHCMLQCIKGTWVVRDLSSTNGTFLNKQCRLEPNKAYKIKNGDIIYLGGESASLRVQL